MALFTSETIERVRQAADIVEVVSAHTDLRRAGERYTGLCPFHDERTPSFSVNAADGLYYCFGCEAGGDIFGFLSAKEGLDFPDAVEVLGDRYGIDLEYERSDPKADEERRRRARLTEALERAAAYYGQYLWEAPKAKASREYLLERGLTEELLKRFGVGMAPSDWGTILTRGQQAGYSIEELTSAGLIQKGQKGGFYDRFRSRIIFPIRDPRGRALGFGARALTADQKPKYLNSPESATYHKSKALYGIEQARPSIAKSRRAVVVEGYTDVIALHQIGVTEAVAICGTAITPEQLTMLGAYAEEVVLALDADRAGREAMLRAERVAGGKRAKLRVAAMPIGEDPAEMVAGGGGDRFIELVEQSVSMPVFHVRAILDEADLSSPEGRDRALDEAVPVLAGMGETISRDELNREVADRLDAEPSLVATRVARAPRGAPPAPKRQSGATTSRGSETGTGGQSGSLDGGGGSAIEGDPGPEGSVRQGAGPRDAVEIGASGASRMSPAARRELALLSMCIAAPAEGQHFIARLSPEHMSSPVSRRAVDWLREHLTEPLEGLPPEDPELAGLIGRLKMRAESEPASSEAMEINFLELERRRIDRALADLEGSSSEAVTMQRRRAELSERIARSGQLPGP